MGQAKGIGHVCIGESPCCARGRFRCAWVPSNSREVSRIAKWSVTFRAFCIQSTLLTQCTGGISRLSCMYVGVLGQLEVHNSSQEQRNTVIRIIAHTGDQPWLVMTSDGRDNFEHRATVDRAPIRT